MTSNLPAALSDTSMVAQVTDLLVKDISLYEVFSSPSFTSSLGQKVALRSSLVGKKANLENFLLRSASLQNPSLDLSIWKEELTKGDKSDTRSLLAQALDKKKVEYFLEQKLSLHSFLTFLSHNDLSPEDVYRSLDLFEGEEKTDLKEAFTVSLLLPVTLKELRDAPDHLKCFLLPQAPLEISDEEIWSFCKKEVLEEGSFSFFTALFVARPKLFFYLAQLPRECFSSSSFTVCQEAIAEYAFTSPVFQYKVAGIDLLQETLPENFTEHYLRIWFLLCDNPYVDLTLLKRLRLILSNAPSLTSEAQGLVLEIDARIKELEKSSLEERFFSYYQKVLEEIKSPYKKTDCTLTLPLLLKSEFLTLDKARELFQTMVTHNKVVKASSLLEKSLKETAVKFPSLKKDLSMIKVSLSGRPFKAPFSVSQPSFSPNAVAALFCESNLEEKSWEVLFGLYPDFLGTVGEILEVSQLVVKETNSSLPSLRLKDALLPKDAVSLEVNSGSVKAEATHLSALKTSANTVKPIEIEFAAEVTSIESAVPRDLSKGC